MTLPSDPPFYYNMLGVAIVAIVLIKTGLWRFVVLFLALIAMCSSCIAATEWVGSDYGLNAGLLAAVVFVALFLLGAAAYAYLIERTDPTS